MWTVEHRRAADRRGLRYPSDLTDTEWALIAPLIPPAKHGGRKRSVDVREVLNGIFYVLSTGCQWNALPKDLPPKSTVYDYFDLWEWDGTLERIHYELYVAMRDQEGREASPSVAVIDSQSTKAAQTYGPPRCKQFDSVGPRSLQKRIRPSGIAVGQDGDPRVLVLIKGPASMRHFTPKGSKTPVDCQAIFLSPPADLMCRRDRAGPCRFRPTGQRPRKSDHGAATPR
jgi:transposase